MSDMSDKFVAVSNRLKIGSIGSLIGSNLSKASQKIMKNSPIARKGNFLTFNLHTHLHHKDIVQKPTHHRQLY
jgi:hypothetical protein